MKQIVILLMVAAGVASSSAQFAIDWFTIDGGGGTSTNQNYTVAGTIGQHDAANLVSGGAYGVQGGFWPAVHLVQTEGAPTLFVNRAGANVVLSWAPATPGFTLQHSTTLATGSWQNAASLGTNPVTIPAAGTFRYYRLLRP